MRAYERKEAEIVQVLERLEKTYNSGVQWYRLLGEKKEYEGLRENTKVLSGAEVLTNSKARVADMGEVLDGEGFRLERVSEAGARAVEVECKYRIYLEK